MKIKRKTKFLIIIMAIYLVLLIFLRFYNVGHTARFTEDESGFVVRVHQIFVERKITLVGQVNELGTKVFGSLSVYLLLPFAILGKFSAVSIFYGASFWGVLTALALFYLSKLINRKVIIFSAILSLIWFPLVQLGRWAWNPNFIPLWVALGIICYLLAQQNKTNRKYFFSLLIGVFFGLSVHQHYYAVFGTAFFIMIIALENLIRKRFKQAILPGIGFALTLLPFIIFDLRHPPGIFLLGAASQSHITVLSQILTNFVDYSSQIMKYYAQSALFSTLLGVVIVIIFVIDLIKKNKSTIFILPCIFQIFLIAFLGLYFPHYFFVIIPFFFVWIIYPRKGLGKYLTYIALVILIIGSLISIIPEITNSPVSPDLPTVDNITSILKSEIKNGDLKNVNIVVLGSSDHNTAGRKYRDLLLVPDNLQIKSRGEYSITDNLFVISESSESVVRSDPAPEMSGFRSGKLRKEWQIDNSSWVIYLFNRDAKKKTK